MYRLCLPSLSLYSCLAVRKILVLAIGTIAIKATALCADRVNRRVARVEHSILNLLQGALIQAWNGGLDGLEGKPKEACSSCDGGRITGWEGCKERCRLAALVVPKVNQSCMH